jgi:galacturan 1,4-alpha-galacturonidase
MSLSDLKILQGHGISIGSIASGSKVSKVTISGNNVTDSMYGLRIKTVYGATDASGQSTIGEWKCTNVYSFSG